MKAQAPHIQIGILSAKSIRLKLNGSYKLKDEVFQDIEMGAKILSDNSFILKTDNRELILHKEVVFSAIDKHTDSFDLYDVLIGIQFHWERTMNQRFRGDLKLFAKNGKLWAINILDLEEYLLSVISSEMSATSSLELLKTHAVISRSWLLAQLEKTKKNNASKYNSFQETEDGYIRWYDKEDHEDFDVCADDHCQRYQGISMVSSEQVAQALSATKGEVLTYDDKICDARFYKCCGGVTELFENTWEPINHPYLTKVIDNPTFPKNYKMDLSIEENARQWMTSKPSAFCNTNDVRILSQVLNNYDQETTDFYRWKVELSQDNIKQLLKTKIDVDLGDIIDLIAVERGVSGRIIKLKIKGSKGEVTIGKELEIRKALSSSHLYSSAFVVDKITDKNNPKHSPAGFILRGAGWGHGVGLCQIGAAVMSEKSYSYQEILQHYFPNTELRTIY